MGEVNNAVVRRRQAVDALSNALDDQRSSDCELHEEPAHEALLTFANAFQAHLSELLDPAAGSGAPVKMARTLRRLDTLVDTLDAAASRRPGAKARAYLGVAQELQRIWPIYREALTTLDMAHAQELGSQGQFLLDRAPRFISDARTVGEAIDVLTSQSAEPSLTRRLQLSLQILHPGASRNELVEEGARRARQVTGSDVADGASMSFLILEVVASAFYSPQVFSLKVREASQVCAPPERLREIAAMDGALQGLEHLRRDLFETLNHFTQVVATERRGAAVVRRLARSVGELQESAMPLLVWYRLLVGAAEGVDQYRKFLEWNSTDLISKLNHRLPTLSADMPAYLRNSAHHGSAFNFDESQVTVTIALRSHKEVMDLDDYVDRVLALLESLQAAMWALDAALELAGINVPTSTDDAEYMGLFSHDLATWNLEHRFGIDDVQSTVRNGTWTVEASLPPTEVLTTALALAEQASPGIERLTVAVTGLPSEPLEIDLVDYNDYSEQVGIDSATTCIALLELRHKTTRGRTCLLSHPDVEFAVATLANLLLNDQPTMVKRLRKIRDLAHNHGFDDLENLATSAIASLRTGDADSLRRKVASLAATATAPAVPTGPRVTVHLQARTQSTPCIVTESQSSPAHGAMK
ncbi:hypothetical protein IGS67_08600 [Flavimobilis sp. GY10621]|uniref:Uncharacterized protein n=1 Tax=Flavimobilis rhizosphaerae TaxID=2775421 RepID=A0ABR9DQY4_9MICO|nr:hypothetical protein [Flavimobilis rhizosphaerae]MBD9699547.1 hypothetical protein [Flavimobilis rhizosphaerae]